MVTKTFTLSDSIPWAIFLTIATTSVVLASVYAFNTIGFGVVLATAIVVVILVVIHYVSRYLEARRTFELLFGVKINFSRGTEIPPYFAEDNFWIPATVMSELISVDLVHQSYEELKIKTAVLFKDVEITVVPNKIVFYENGVRVEAKGTTNGKSIQVVGMPLVDEDTMCRLILHELGHVALNAVGYEQGYLGARHHQIMAERKYNY